jgi:hypothetical protein
VVDAQNIHDRSMGSDRRRQKLPVKESSTHLPQMSQLGKMRPRELDVILVTDHMIFLPEPDAHH